MGLIRRLVSFLGFSKDEADELRNGEENDTASAPASAAAAQHIPRKGFGVPVQVAVDRPPPGPVLVPCISGDGGVQGFRWFARRLKIDEDGDVADEFLDEILPDSSLTVEEHQRPFPRFEVKYSTRPAKVRNQVRAIDGRILQRVEFQGRLEWV